MDDRACALSVAVQYCEQLALISSAGAVCCVVLASLERCVSFKVVAASSRKELLQMIVTEQMTLAAVSSKANAFVKTFNKRFCMIERQFLKYGKGIGENVSRAVKYYRLSADLNSASAQNSFGISLE
jgi:hypothetical protein